MSSFHASAPSGSTTPVAASTDDRTVAIVSYLTIIGFIVAIVLHASKKNALGTFHLRQSLGLILTAVAIAVAGMVLAFVPYVGWMVSAALWVSLLVLWVMGLLSALKGEAKPVPVLGEQFQTWFAGTFN